MGKISGLFGALILAIGVASCGGGGAATVTGGGGGGGGGGGTCPANTFCMGAASFVTATATAQPVTLTVAVNTAVTWTNDSPVDHNVTFDDPASALAVGTGTSGTFAAPVNSSNQRQFAVSGSSHPFHCTIHGTTTTGMRGTVTIQ